VHRPLSESTAQRPRSRVALGWVAVLGAASCVQIMGYEEGSPRSSAGAGGQSSTSGSGGTSSGAAGEAGSPPGAQAGGAGGQGGQGPCWTCGQWWDRCGSGTHDCALPSLDDFCTSQDEDRFADLKLCLCVQCASACSVSLCTGMATYGYRADTCSVCIGGVVDSGACQAQAAACANP
jgi:hypothetical protein